MRALQIVGPERYEIVELPLPEPGEGEVLLRMGACTICNLHDLRVFTGPHERYPLDAGYPGHEGAGEVVALGRGVAGISVGDRVVTTGIGGPPLYREYVTREAGAVVRYDAEVAYSAASPLELFGCINRAVTKTRVEGRRVAVVGLGPAGLVCCQMLAAYGASEIVAVDLAPERRTQAMTMGATEEVDGALFNEAMATVRRYMAAPGRAPEANPLAALDLEPLAPVIFECSGSARSLETSLLLAGEELIMFGVTSDPITAWPRAWFEREITIRASTMLSLADLRTAARLMDAGRVTPGRLISAVLPFQRYGDALAAVREKRVTKVALTWDEHP